jgi:SAM-dependent methyltransferase
MSAPRIRRGDFTEQAGVYARARPSYPRALVDDLVRDAGVVPGDAVVELGAGTGLFTRALAGRGLALTALEPNDAMRAEIGALDGVRSAAGTFEATGLADASQAWAVAAQAFHWADPARALPELRRVLRPGAAFTVLWNVRDVAASDVLARAMRRIHRRAAGFDEGYRDVDWARVLVSTGDFAGPHVRERRHAIPMTRERFLDLWRSHNHLNAALGPEAMAELLAEMDADPVWTGRDEIEIPYVCRAFTARARSA